MSQPQYNIVANSRCRTHPPGTKLVYTGSRCGVSPGWTVLGRTYEANFWANFR